MGGRAWDRGINFTGSGPNTKIYRVLFHPFVVTGEWCRKRRPEIPEETERRIDGTRKMDGDDSSGKLLVFP